MKTLLQQHCQHQTGAAMSDTQVHDHLAQLSSWKTTGGAIEKAFTFKNFHETMAFVNALAWIAHTEDHHPDLQVGYNRCTVHYSTHSVGGLSVNDFICAAKADALVSFVG
ncbi:4a-hydroxytetrahydrobiopterin dehydratase [Rhizobacter sp. Root1221]|jgi:4a-hydroxytetrahydrobiopterin dehydratase|uniref:4a-hydroxytetrahydrobiopterin dehydratase n=1 Tax=Rhizobacter sp. Root1221 TaxID=1736433 RepID=UPI0009E6EA52|nr:4a-hydroxytetrahydrobiopterin dehydratase [Rhizobacter sp. Root1221]